MFPLNTIIAWSINIIMNKKYDNNNIIIASRAYFLKNRPASPGPPTWRLTSKLDIGAFSFDM
jgi:hypothetical protein